jgi:F-type H+-transporting ATPase subunit epsilon
MGVLCNRAPLVCLMGIGPLRIEESNKTHLFFVDGGFAQVVDNRLTVLTEQARRTDELDSAAANQAMVEARAMKMPDDAAYLARTKALRRAQVQLQLLGRSSSRP